MARKNIRPGETLVVHDRMFSPAVFPWDVFKKSMYTGPAYKLCAGESIIVMDVVPMMTWRREEWVCVFLRDGKLWCTEPFVSVRKLSRVLGACTTRIRTAEEMGILHNLFTLMIK